MFPAPTPELSIRDASGSAGSLSPPPFPSSSTSLACSVTSFTPTSRCCSMAASAGGSSSQPLAGGADLTADGGGGVAGGRGGSRRSSPPPDVKLVSSSIGAASLTGAVDATAPPTPAAKAFGVRRGISAAEEPALAAPTAPAAARRSLLSQRGRTTGPHKLSVVDAPAGHSAEILPQTSWKAARAASTTRRLVPSPR